MAIQQIKLLRDLFLEVYCVGYEDGKRQFA
jgi:hypothetical protein